MPKVRLSLGRRVWGGGYVASGIRYVASSNQATALIQLTAKQEMKFEPFISKTPAHVTGFDASAVTFRGG